MTTDTLTNVLHSAAGDIEAKVADLTEELHQIQGAIHDNPQIAFQETFAHDICTQYMEKKGWNVTRHAYGLDTAWEATYEVGTGGPTIGYCSESMRSALAAS